ncbi:glucose-1-phosphate adenylyltransferase family protein [Chloroflexota bacterium]
MLHPFVSRSRRSWYYGTADAIRQNLSYLEDQPVDEVVILSGDHVYTMRYDRMVAYHRKKEADVTIGLSRVAIEEAHRFGIVTVNRQGRVAGFKEKPAEPKSNLVSMGIYVFKKDVLVSLLVENVEKKVGHDFGRNILPKIIQTHKVYGYRHDGYYRDVGTIDSYWQANMDLIVDLPKLNLYNTQNRVQTTFLMQNMPPVKLGSLAEVSRSILSDGAIINGNVVNSIISPGVFIEDGAQVYDSIVFNDSTIRQGAIVNRCIVDKQVIIGAKAHVGWGDDMNPNHEEPENLKTGITLIGKRARVPEGIKIGRNCKVAPRAQKSDFSGVSLPSGSSIRRRTLRH